MPQAWIEGGGSQMLEETSSDELETSSDEERGSGSKDWMTLNSVGTSGTTAEVLSSLPL
jgi:hypothetical protein